MGKANAFKMQAVSCVRVEVENVVSKWSMSSLWSASYNNEVVRQQRGAQMRTPCINQTQSCPIYALSEG